MIYEAYTGGSLDGSLVTQLIKSLIKSQLARMGYTLYRSDHFDIRSPIALSGYDGEEAAREAVKRVRDKTMVAYDALLSLWAQVEYCERTQMPGAYVECGVWKGGVGGFMALANMAFGKCRRPIHLFDAFGDICEPDPEVDGERALAEVEKLTGRERATMSGALSPLSGIYDRLGGPGDEGAVREFVAEEIGYGHENVITHRGWFQNTLPGADTGPIAILRLDGDWYASTKECLEHLYDRVVPGGFVIIDDYGCYDGCRRAVDEFLMTRGSAYLNFVSRDVRYIIKSR